MGCSPWSSFLLQQRATSPMLGSSHTPEHPQGHQEGPISSGGIRGCRWPGLGWQLGLLPSSSPLLSLPEQAARSGVRTPGGSRLPSCCFIAFRRGCGWEQGGVDVAGLGVTCSAKQGQWRGGYRGGTARVEPPLILPAPESEVIFTPPCKRRVL